MAGREVVPALGLESFSCPHVNCGAIAHQTWFKAFAKKNPDGQRPWLADEKAVADFKRDKNVDTETIKFIENLAARKVFLSEHSEWMSVDQELINVHVSKCFSCGGLSLWRADEV